MRINNNIMAMNTHRQYGVNNANVSKSVEKLSSGFRINRAGDDAAGLAISEKMRAQIRGLSMASKNSQDAISLVQTAEGALQESHNILQRMRELAVQSASDTNETTIDRDALNKEFQALIAEIDDTAQKTKFNEMGVINGEFAKFTASTAVTLANATINVDAIGAKATAAVTPATSYGSLSWNFTTSKNTITFTPAGAGAVAETYTLVDGQKSLQLSNGISITFAAAFNSADAAAGAGSITSIFGADSAGTAIDVTVAATGNEFTVQTGANKGDELKININAMSASALGIAAANIADRGAASWSIQHVNNAINQVSSQRADLGALQNRMEHKIANLDTSAENLQAAESRIRDLDMAKEMTAFTKNNILSQAATAMLAQANALPQGVLQLLQ